MGKDFSCSEGKRVERKTKHAAAAPDVIQPIFDSVATTQSITAINSSKASEFQRKLKLRSTLMCYQTLLDMAIRYLGDLKRKSIEPFLANTSSHGYFDDPIENRSCEQFKDFYDTVQMAISRLTSDLLAPGGAPSIISTDLLPDLLGPTVPTFFGGVACPICDEYDDPTNLQVLIESGNVCGEYVARLSRLAQHTKHCHEDEGYAVASEMRRISELSVEMESVVIDTLHNSTVDDFMTFLSKNKKPFKPDAVINRLQLHENPGRDSLGRTHLHQYLDAAPKIDLENLETMLDLLSSNEINEQDIIGRSALHIACQRNVKIVEMLLSGGADPRLETVYGSTPLHYAVAIGSLEICRILILYPIAEIEYDIGGLDHIGNSPLYYATHGNHVAIVKLLLADPQYSGNLNAKNGLLMDAIVMDNEEIVQILLERGAYPVFDKPGAIEAISGFVARSNSARIKELISLAQ
jgi:ankyrin repeat protein